jgi:anti-sigma B factor antagonist
MRLDRQELEGVTVISVAEPLEVDVGNADEFKAKALEAMGPARLVVLDAALVEFFDSAGMAALLSLQKRAAQRQGKMVLACLNRPVEEIFRMVGFDVVFQTYRDVPEAVAALKK